MATGDVRTLIPQKDDLTFGQGEFKSSNYLPNIQVTEAFAQRVDVETALRNSGTKENYDYYGKVRGKIRPIEAERRFANFSGGLTLDQTWGTSYGAAGAGGATGFLSQMYRSSGGPQ